jgi:hypothetical protein
MDRGSVLTGQITHAFEVIVTQDLDDTKRWRRAMNDARRAAERAQSQKVKDALLKIVAAYETAIANARAAKRGSPRKTKRKPQSRPWESAFTSDNSSSR